MRASDADRDRAAQVLAQAMTEGRLGHEEHGERLDAVYRAKTMAELTPITADLPGGTAAAAPTPASAPPRPASQADADLIASATGSENIVAVLSSAERKGRWLVEPRTNVSVLLGSVELDMRTALLSRNRVVVQCSTTLGGVTLIVPHGVAIENHVNGTLGGVGVEKGRPEPAEGAPTVVVTGHVLLGGIEIKSSPEADVGYGC
ncbi:hypothetical protein HNR23_004202 [Nocardiopsis mwathae]|uniref:Cell wall-active antibiotics response LiaF-like C-terminal domain-containing protein n=1 Tax=Nocardiopsis mwathae TaxID=1472723 RepID=A0A7W9YL91_9ACTN|nr:DUF1707 domain-containing protein [Nocardiopsis mwathae]MBB6174142.1 hypothetical protein [Nocardiopsis mwathae]